MDLINYDRLKACKPTLLHTMLNSRDQWVEFYEDPTFGDESDILATINGVAFHTGFFDLGDFYAGSDYLPVLTNEGTVVCQFELG